MAIQSAPPRSVPFTVRIPAIDDCPQPGDEDHPPRTDPRRDSLRAWRPQARRGPGRTRHPRHPVRTPGYRRRDHRLGRGVRPRRDPGEIAALRRVIAPLALGRDPTDIAALM